MKKQTNSRVAFAIGSLLSAFPPKPGYTYENPAGSPNVRKRRIKRKAQRKARRTNRK